MKKKSIISLFTLVLSALVLTTSCEDMLTPDMDRYASKDEFGKDTVYSALGILRSIQRVAERTVILDAGRSDLVTGGTYTTDSVNDIMNFNNPEDGSSALCNVADYYHIVNSCNFYLANVDTTIVKNNVKIMQREWAQVQAMRAWAYIQLVRNYGEVPFVTTTVSSTDEAASAMANAPKVNAANLADLLAENGLTRAYELQRQFGIPDYGSFNNGVGSYSSTWNFFPVELVLADAYLMSENYPEAARYYYEFFIYDCDDLPGFRTEDHKAGYTSRGENEIYVHDGSYRQIFTNNFSARCDRITTVTGASAGSIGQVLTRQQNLTGFNTRISGTSISVTPDEQYMQMMPSEQLVSLCKAQRYNAFEMSGGVALMREAEGGDGRLGAIAPIMELNNGTRTRMIAKWAPVDGNNIRPDDIVRRSPIMNYQIPLYRNSIIALRYAEAVNRMGFPELAFGVLKDGLAKENFPTFQEDGLIWHYSGDVIIIPRYDGEEFLRNDTIRNFKIAQIIYDEDNYGTLSFDEDETKIIYGDIHVGMTIPEHPYLLADGTPYEGPTLEDIPADIRSQKLGRVEYLGRPESFNGGMYYLSLEEVKAMRDYPFLSFSEYEWRYGNEITEKNIALGLHARGCGFTGGVYDTVYTYARQVAEKIAEDYARKNNLTYAQQQDYAKTLYDGTKLLVTDKEAIQNAVENIIVDELALETAFEGNRYGDLIRIAGHKNAAGYDGTDWFAWKIARRNQKYTDDASKVDATLKAKLLNPKNWYLSLPK